VDFPNGRQTLLKLSARRRSPRGVGLPTALTARLRAGEWSRPGWRAVAPAGRWGSWPQPAALMEMGAARSQRGRPLQSRSPPMPVERVIESSRSFCGPPAFRIIPWGCLITQPRHHPKNSSEQFWSAFANSSHRLTNGEHSCSSEPCWPLLQDPQEWELPDWRGEGARSTMGD